MTTIAMTVPGGIPNGHVIQTPYGNCTVVGGVVTVDVRVARSLMAKGYTSIHMPDITNLTREQNLAMTAPVANGVLQHDGKTYVISGGSVTVPRHAIPALVDAGFQI